MPTLHLMLCTVYNFQVQVVLSNLQQNTFVFDSLYGAGMPGALESCSMYKNHVEQLVDGVFSGFNATIFAYGQTGG